MNTDCLFITLKCITVLYHLTCAFLSFISKIIQIGIKYVWIYKDTHNTQKNKQTNNKVPPRALKICWFFFLFQGKIELLTGPCK